MNLKKNNKNKMKHHITYEVNINGILYKNLTEEFRSEIIDFYFEVFLKGNVYALVYGINIL